MDLLNKIMEKKLTEQEKKDYELLKIEISDLINTKNQLKTILENLEKKY